MKKSIFLISSIVVICLCLSVGVFAGDALEDESELSSSSLFAEGNFNDVPTSHWAHRYIMTMSRYNVLNGYSGNVFRPEQSITRAEAVTICSRLWGGSIPSAGSNLPFNDISNHWAKNAIVWAYNKGIVNGVGNGMFQPNSYVSRQDLSVMAVRFAENAELKSIPNLISKSAFRDDSNIASYAKTAIYKLQRGRIISGNPNNYFYPTNSIKRSEASRIFYGILMNVLASNNRSDTKDTVLVRNGIAPTAYKFKSSLSQYYRANSQYITFYRVRCYARLENPGHLTPQCWINNKNVNLKRGSTVVKSRSLDYYDDVLTVSEAARQHCSIYKTSIKGNYSTSVSVGAALYADEGLFAINNADHTVSITY